MITGWIFNLAILESVVPNAVTMKLSTAVSFLMGGIILYLINESKSKNSELARVLLPAPIMVVSFYMITLLVSTFTGIDSGIENLFIREKPVALGSVLPGIPSVAVMINFLLIVSVSILSLLRYEKHGREISIIGGIIFGVGVIALLGYVVNIPAMYYLINGFSSAMAIHSAITFLLIGFAFMIYSKTKRSEVSQKDKFVSIRTKILTILFSGMVPVVFLISLFLSSSSQNFSTVIPEMVALLSFVAVASFFIAKFITVPITKLQKIAQEIGKGNFDLDVQVNTNDEIGQLSLQLLKMKENIKFNELELKKTNQALKIVEKQKEEFSAMITHELKSSLVPIKGYADLLLSGHMGELNERQKERLSIIASSTAHLGKLISDILDAQKLEMGVLKLQLNEYVLSDLINDILVKLRTELEKQKITVITTLRQNVKCVCDQDRIEQVLINLINNSIDFCPKSDGKIRIDLTVEGDCAKIMVTDNGVGIPADKLEKIFTKFYQVDSSLTREHGGTGIGLSICRGIIEEHGGKIWAESKIGQGAVFHILLPTNPSQTFEESKKPREEIIKQM